MDNDKILVEIASYCDPELLNTINSALIQAYNKERIYFSICYQNDDITDYEKLKKIKNCKIKWLKENETKGSCYARYLCQKMIDDEKYVYQIDSHMRFVKNWDKMLIEELLSLNDNKAIISFYPPNCDEEMMRLPLDDKIFDTPAEGGLMYASNFFDNDTPFIKICCESLKKNDSRNHIKSAFISGGNFFSYSQVHKEVFHDTEMYFYGDELFMDINLFTHGWNIYNSNKSYIYHNYGRKKQRISIMEKSIEKEKDRLLKLLTHKNNKKYLKEFKIGNERTIEEFEKFSGIDFKNRIIYMNAETGEIENEKYIGKISLLSKKDLENKRGNNYIEVLIIDLFDDYRECINNCLNTAINKDNISFIIGTISNKSISKNERLDMNIKNYIQFDKNTTYSKILNQISKYTSNNYVAIIDAGIRFIKGWDKYLCDNLKQCGNNSVLTSWVWETNNDTNNQLEPYINIDKKIKCFYNYLPVLEYDENVDLSNINNPYQTSFIFNGFIFCHSKILKKIEVDPNLNYEEHKYIYAIRLWTNGIDLYLPKLSYVVRNKEEKELIDLNSNISVLCALSGIKNAYSKKIEDNYNYDIGNERPLWTWYNKINVKYDTTEKEIIND